MPDRLKDIYDTLEEMQAGGLGGGGGATDVSALATEVTLAAALVKLTQIGTNTNVAGLVADTATNTASLDSQLTAANLKLAGVVTNTAETTVAVGTLETNVIAASGVQTLALNGATSAQTTALTTALSDQTTALGADIDAVTAEVQAGNVALGTLNTTTIPATTTAVTTTGAATVSALGTLGTGVVAASQAQTTAIGLQTTAQTAALEAGIAATTSAVQAVNTSVEATNTALGDTNLNLGSIDVKLTEDALVQAAIAGDIYGVNNVLLPQTNIYLSDLQTDTASLLAETITQSERLLSLDNSGIAIHTELQGQSTALGLNFGKLIDINLVLDDIKTSVVADASVQVASKTVLDNLKVDSGVIKGDTATLVSQGATTVSTLTSLNTVTVPAITTALGSLATEVTLASVLSKLSEIELNTDSATSGANTSTLDAQLTAVNTKLAADALVQTQILNRVDNVPEAWNALNNLEILVIPATTTAVNSVATLLTAQNTTFLPNIEAAVDNVQSATRDVVTAVNETYLELQEINTASSGSKITLDSVLLELQALNAKVNPDQALTSVTNSSVPSSITSVILALANPTRRSFSLFNNSTSVLYLTFDVTASQATAAVPIAPGGYYEMPKPLYLGDISGIWASANGNASICQGV